MAADVRSELQAGEEALAECRWVEARAAFERAVDAGAGEEALEGLAQAAFFLVHVVVWGREEHTELVAALRALAPLLPPAPPGAPGPFTLSYPGALETLVEQAGLTPAAAGYIELTFEYPDETTLLKGNNSNGPVVLAERTSGDAIVVNAVRDALAPFRTASGAYRIETEWRYVTAKALLLDVRHKPEAERPTWCP